MDMTKLQMFSEGEAAAAAESLSPDEGGNADARFDCLIKGEYRDAYHKRVQSIIDKRFSKMKAMEGTISSFTPLIEHMASAFPEIDKSDTAGLIKAYLERDNLQNAEKTEEKIPSAFIRAVEGKLKLRAAAIVKSRLLESADSLREIYPSFDLHRELSSSPEMKDLLSAGVPLRRAFETVNLEKIMGSALRYAVMKAGRDAAQSVRSNTRISENSLSDHASSVRQRNVNNLTEKDIHEILAAVGNGEKVRF